MLPTRILIADDHQLFLDGLHSLLDRIDGCEVIGEAGTGEEVLVILAQTPVDCVLLDVQMPALNGIETTKRIKKQFPGVRILAVSMDNDYGTVRAMLRAGADGYLIKNVGKAELVKALEAVGHGEIYVSPELTPVLFHGLANRKPPTLSYVETLTQRERDVLKLIVDGLTNEQIAKKLFLSPLTVKTHRSNMLSKLNCTNTAALVKYAVDNNLLNRAPK
ncbi:response regulator [Spirosoma aerolatum]|uniref:response regulator n=1 Tax=Spirosoma aerolatum TaxID=1211326 RepID=UPI0009AD00A9|nr:response regulator transcription factor [Spirosoma aerolatum]